MMLVLLFIVTVRKESQAPDVGIVKGVKPFSTVILLGKGKYLPRGKLRRYAVHMSYDEAVIETRREMRAKGWVDFGATYGEFMSCAPDSDEYVLIRRSRVDLDLKVPARHPSAAIAPSFAMLSNTLGQPIPDPRGWVTVTTYRQISAVDGLYERIVRLPRMRRFEYVEISRDEKRPWENVYPAPPVDVHEGTTHLEGNDIRATFYSASN